MNPTTGIGRRGSLSAVEVVPWSCATLAVLLFPLLGSIGSGVEFLPWAVGLLFFGLPHGACDHLVAAKLTGRSSRTDFAAFVLVYLSLSLSVVALWLLNAGIALAAFLLLTAWHWGSADAAATEEAPSRFLLLSFARGTLVISAPVALHTESSWSAFVAVMNVFEKTPASSAPGWLFPLALAGLVGASLVEVFLSLRSLMLRGIRVAAPGAVELSLLLGLFFFVQPVAAVGVYFVFWHAWRHVLRVGGLLFRTRQKRTRSLKHTVLDYHAKAIPFTVLSLAALVVLAVLSQPQGLQNLLGTYLVLISAVTLPHATIVALWDVKLKLHFR